MDSSSHALQSRIQIKTHCHAENQGLATLGFHTHPLRPAQAEPVIRRVNVPPTKEGCSSPFASIVGHKFTHSHMPWTEAYYIQKY